MKNNKPPTPQKLSSERNNHLSLKQMVPQLLNLFLLFHSSLPQIDSHIKKLDSTAQHNLLIVME